MEESIVVVRHLSHRYQVQWAIRDINFEITKNGVYGLLGSNGAGKSTTMNIMCGVLKPTEGEVYIEGVNLREHPVEARKHNGFLPQKPPLQVDLTVREFLTYCAHLRQIPPREVRMAVDEVMDKCKIRHFNNRLIRNLSGGYQQRVGIAQAIIHKPELVVLDEPTNGLDPNQIVEIRHLVREIAQERTVVLSTHILPEVQASCDYIYMIEHGSVVFDGSIEEFDNYLTPDTLYVRFAGKIDPAGLEALEGVKQVEAEGEGFRIRFAEVNEVTGRIIESSVAHNWELREIYPEKTSLDAVFAELSKKEK